MWVDEASAQHFQSEVDAHGSVILEGVPVPAARFITRDGDPSISLAVIRLADGRYSVLVPDDLTPRTADALAVMDGVALGDSGWRSLRLQSSASVPEVLAEAGLVLGLDNAGGPARDLLASAVASAQRDPNAEPNAAADEDERVLVPFTYDLTAAAERGELPVVHGRDREVEEIMIILLQRVRNCPLLVGEPGVGKTAVAEKLAHATCTGDMPAPLRSLRVLALDLPELVAASGARGALEHNVREMIAALEADRSLLLFVDEFHTLAEVRADLSLLDIVKPRMARGLRLMGATTQAEYKEKITLDQALVRRMDIVRVEEPSPEETVEILMARLPELRRHHGIKVEYSQVAEIVRLSAEYMPDRRRPDSALMLLDRSMAAQALEGVS